MGKGDSGSILTIIVSVMLCIEGVRFLCKVEGFLDRISAPETVVRIVFDDNFALPPLKGSTKQNTTTWEELIPPIELSPYQPNYKIEFALYREGVLIGTGATSFAFTETRKDCLDIADKDSRVTGKLVYDLKWIKGAKTGTYVTYEQFTSSKVGGGLQAGEPIIAAKIATEKEKKYVPQKAEEDCGGGFCACFAVRKKKPKAEAPSPAPQTKYIEPQSKYTQAETKLKATVDPPTRKQQSSEAPSEAKFLHRPFVYFEEDLQQGKMNDIQQLNRLVYYSKAFVTSK